MRLLEYQAKELFAARGIPVPEGKVCESPEEVAETMFEGGVAVKAQVPAGKRGKGGGIKFASTPAEAEQVAREILGREICGYPVNRVLVERRSEIIREFYLAVLTDVDVLWGCPMIIFSAAGGMDIEELSAQNPKAIRRVHIEPLYGIMNYQIQELLPEDLSAEEAKQLAAVISKIYQIYWETDAELVEINPLGLTPDGRLVALDGKINIDNSARYRHPEIEEIIFPSAETEAAAKGLSYVQLEGDIGLISNGAGLTMATMDRIGLLGGNAANFLDTGERIVLGGIEDGLRIIAANPRVTRILINVFGGGVRCDIIAEKIVEAVQRGAHGGLPLVVCLRGRNEDTGAEVIRKADLPELVFIPETDQAIKSIVGEVGSVEYTG